MPLDLTFAAVHTLLAAVAGLFLWKLWRRFARLDATAGLIVGCGLIVRIVCAEVLFWTSYAGLPIARRLQDGTGFWKFALDAEAYFGYARNILAGGWRPLFLIDRSLPSPIYVQVLAFFILLFGTVTFVGALLNLFAYLAGCEAVLRVGGVNGQARWPTLIALAALSFSPSLVLWSTQPLKDVFFVSSVAAFIAACSLWWRAWAANSRWPRLAASLALLLVTIYVIAGVRWYFALLLCFPTLPFLLTTISGNRRPLLAGLVNAGVFLLLVWTVVLASGPYLPPPVYRMLTTLSPTEIAEASGDILRLIARSREGFDATHTNSQIQAGDALTHAEAQPDPAPPGASQVPAPHVARQVTARPGVRQVPGANRVAPVPPAPKRFPRRGQSQPPAVSAGSSVARSVFTRIAAGTVAVILPRFLGEALGFIHVGGGSGLWPMVDADTLLFDILLVIVLVHVVRGVAAGALRDPSFWLVALMTAGIAVLLTYTISNFGTLFRHRSMILVGLCLLLAVARGTSPRGMVSGEPAA